MADILRSCPLYWNLKYHFFWFLSEWVVSCILFSVSIFALVWVLDRPGMGRLVRRFGPALAAAVSLSWIVYYLMRVATYATSSALVDWVEPNLIAVSWLWGRGWPVYHEFASAERYSICYGPIGYVVYWAFLSAFGPSIPAVKIVSALAVVLTLGGLFWLLLRETSPLTALVGTAACAVGLSLDLSDYLSAYYVRYDSLLILLTVVGIFGCRGRSPATAAVVLGTTLGLSVGLKIHGFVYQLPMLALLYQRHGLAVAAKAIAISGVVAILPFLTLPGVSLSLYVQSLREGSSRASYRTLALSTIEGEVGYLMPCIIALVALAMSDRGQFSQLVKRNVPFLAALGVAMFLILAVASKVGAGPHHLMSFVPILAFSFGKFLHQIPSAGTSPRWAWRALLAASISYAAFVMSREFETHNDHWEIEIRENRRADRILAEIERVQARYPNVAVGMGYGGEDSIPLTYYRVALVFQGHPLLLDAVAIVDIDWSGRPPIAPATFDAMRVGKVPVWLIPAGDEPFSVFPHLFDRAFLGMFHEHYEKRERTGFFDVWVYRQDRRPPKL